MTDESKALKVLRILKKQYPQAKIALKFSNHLELMVATILSAQCTDVRVNMVTQELFKKYRSVSDWANADFKELCGQIRPVGFFRNKARNIIGAANMINNRFNGHIPQTMQELIILPGVARKTANIILFNAFSKNEGIAVDTHVRRLSLRIGFTKSKMPLQIEKDLMRLFKRRDWGRLNDLLVMHGRKVCIASSPKCIRCCIKKFCKYFLN